MNTSMTLTILNLHRLVFRYYQVNGISELTVPILWLLGPRAKVEHLVCNMSNSIRLTGQPDVR